MFNLNPEELKLGEDNQEEKESEQKSKGELDGAILEEMIMTGENTDGMFTPNKDEVLNENDPDDALHAEIDEDAKIKTGKVGKKFGKYQNKFLQDMKKNPEAYMIMTPKGRMKVTEAMKQGYDPVTKEFTDKTAVDELEEGIKGLPEEEQAALRTLTDPKSAHMAPAQGEEMGLEPGNPMMSAPPGAIPPEEEEADLAAMLGGKI